MTYLNKKFLKIFMFFWLISGLLFWLFYFVFINVEFPVLYYFVIFIFFGLPFYFKKNKIISKLSNWKLNSFFKFMLLGFLTVVIEEILAGFFNHLTEGFNLTICLLRCFEFIFLNLFVFVGFYLAWYYLYRKFNYSYFEVFFISGFFSLFLERVFINFFLLDL